MEQKKVITVGQIAKCYCLYVDIFCEEDQDYPDGRVVSNKNNAIERTLKKMIGEDEEMLRKARDIVENLMPNDGGTWKPLCDKFRALGFTVVDGDSKGNPSKKEDK